MKHLLFVATIVLCFSCGVEEATPETPVNDMFDAGGATTLKAGMFVNAVHQVSGNVTLFETSGTHTVLLDSFMSENGPDLRVYLSKDDKATEYVSLGKMKSTTGRQAYEVPKGTVVSDYKYVLIWCQQFSVLFGKAELK